MVNVPRLFALRNDDMNYVIGIAAFVTAFAAVKVFGLIALVVIGMTIAVVSMCR